MKVAVGVIPRHAHRYDDEIEQALRAALSAAKKNAGAIGSCGIDDVSDTVQLAAFTRQVALAKELALPLIVKAPACEGRAFEIVQESDLPFDQVLLRVDGIDEASLSSWVEAGSYLSFNAAHANEAEALYRFAETLPADRIMVESGASRRFSAWECSGTSTSPLWCRIYKESEIRGRAPFLCAFFKRLLNCAIIQVRVFTQGNLNATGG